MEEQVDHPLAWLAPFRRHFKLSSPTALPVGVMTACEAGDMQVMHLSGKVQHLRLEHLEGRPIWIVGIIQRDGSAVLEQGAVSPTLLPERLALLTSATPFEVEFASEQPMRQTWLVLPAETLHGICPDFALAKPAVMNCAGPHVEILNAVADLLLQRADTRLAQAGQHIANAVAHLMAAAVVAEGLAETPSRTSLAKFHLSRIKQFVLANLYDPELTVRKVSERLKISPSHIHRMFLSERQTFGEWLWDQRLVACRDALEKTANTGLSISQIAFGHGFSNSSHFSRAFKARFGMSPSEAREAHAGKGAKR